MVKFLESINKKAILQYGQALFLIIRSNANIQLGIKYLFSLLYLKFIYTGRRVKHTWERNIKLCRCEMNPERGFLRILSTIVYSNFTTHFYC